MSINDQNWGYCNNQNFVLNLSATVAQTSALRQQCNFIPEKLFMDNDHKIDN